MQKIYENMVEISPKIGTNGVVDATASALHKFCSEQRLGVTIRQTPGWWLWQIVSETGDVLYGCVDLYSVRMILMAMALGAKTEAEVKNG